MNGLEGMENDARTKRQTNKLQLDPSNIFTNFIFFILENSHTNITMEVARSFLKKNCLYFVSFLLEIFPFFIRSSSSTNAKSTLINKKFKEILFYEWMYLNSNFCISESVF